MWAEQGLLETGLDEDYFFSLADSDSYDEWEDEWEPFEDRIDEEARGYGDWVKMAAMGAASNFGRAMNNPEEDGCRVDYARQVLAQWDETRSV